MKYSTLLFVFASVLLSAFSVSAKSALPPIVTMASKVDNKFPIDGAASIPVKSLQIPNALKLIIGAGGIYSAFLYYGTLQEDVFHYTAANGDKFKAAWFLQALGKFLCLKYLIYRFLPSMTTAS
ncbi:hypothetical protein EON65_28840 [archaeon]|nr:MAG: hypothetical protein EON65_28840 [archaeon]